MTLTKFRIEWADRIGEPRFLALTSDGWVTNRAWARTREEFSHLREGSMGDLALGMEATILKTSGSGPAAEWTRTGMTRTFPNSDVVLRAYRGEGGRVWFQDRYLEAIGNPETLWASTENGKRKGFFRNNPEPFEATAVIAEMEG